MTFNELVTMYFERFNAMQALWGVYITIALGILAFFGTIGQSRKARYVALLISIGFIAVAFVNETALKSVVDARARLYDAIQGYQVNGSKEDQAVVDQLKPMVTKLYPTWMLLTFHIGADMGVLAAIWGLTLRGEAGGKKGDS